MTLLWLHKVFSRIWRRVRAVSISIISFSLLLCRSDVCAIVVSYLIWLGIFSRAVIKIRHTQVRRENREIWIKTKKVLLLCDKQSYLVPFFPRFPTSILRYLQISRTQRGSHWQITIMDSWATQTYPSFFFAFLLLLQLVVNCCHHHRWEKTQVNVIPGGIGICQKNRSKLLNDICSTNKRTCSEARFFNFLKKLYVEYWNPFPHFRPVCPTGSHSTEKKVVSCWDVFGTQTRQVTLHPNPQPSQRGR